MKIFYIPLFFSILVTMAPIHLKAMPEGFSNEEKNNARSDFGSGAKGADLSEKRRLEAAQRTANRETDGSATFLHYQHLDDQKDASEFPTDAQNTLSTTKRPFPENGKEALRLAVQHYFSGILQSMAQTKDSLKAEINVKKNLIFQSKDEILKKTATDYFAITDTAERQKSLVELEERLTTKNLKKLYMYLVYIENLTTAKMLLNTALEEAQDFITNLQDVEQRPTHMALYLAGFNSIETRIVELQKSSHDIIQLNKTIVEFRNQLAQNNQSETPFRYAILDSRLYNTQQAINEYVAAAEVIGFSQAARNLAQEHRLQGKKRLEMMRRQGDLAKIQTDLTPEERNTLVVSPQYTLLFMNNRLPVKILKTSHTEHIRIRNALDKLGEELEGRKTTINDLEGEYRTFLSRKMTTRPPTLLPKNNDVDSRLDDAGRLDDIGMQIPCTIM